MKLDSNLSILFWLKGKEDREGRKNLYVRITIDGVRAEIATGKNPCQTVGPGNGQA